MSLHHVKRTEAGDSNRSAEPPYALGGHGLRKNLTDCDILKPLNGSLASWFDEQRELVGHVAPMILKELAIDRLAATKPVFNVVPEADSLFAEFPAKMHFFAAIQCREVHQPALNIFNLATGLKNAVDGAFRSFRLRSSERGGIIPPAKAILC
jgi:hypothetical protein